MRAILTAIFAGLLPVAGVTAVAVDATQEPTAVVTTTAVTTTTIATTSATVPVTTTLPKPTTTTTTLPDLSGVDWVQLARDQYGRCGEWRSLALAVGWPVEEWPTLSRVLYRESRCNIDSWNQTDPAGGSRGLMQINGYWCRKSQWSQAGWLQDQGILTTCEDLYNPEINLRAGLAIWLYGEQKHGCGWRGPWATPCA